MSDAQALSDIEATSLGFDPLFQHAIEPNTNTAQGYDREGRQIISYQTYLDLCARNSRLDNYVLRWIRPGHRGQWLLQASKYQKWFGDGLRAIGSPELANKTPPREAVAVPVAAPDVPEDVTLFWCRDKFPDCKRVFDTQKGIDWHWKRDHKVTE